MCLPSASPYAQVGYNVIIADMLVGSAPNFTGMLPTVRLEACLLVAWPAMCLTVALCDVACCPSHGEGVSSSPSSSTICCEVLCHGLGLSFNALCTVVYVVLCCSFDSGGAANPGAAKLPHFAAHCSLARSPPSLLFLYF
jgi:hypothetical protein